MSYPIELGRNHPLYNDFPSPSSTVEDYYPDVRFEWSEPYKLPASGTITFKFRTTKEETKTYPDGEQKFCLDIELLEIVGAKASKASKVTTDERSEASETLDKLRDESSEAYD